MSNHHCQSLVFRCLDFRLKPSILSSLLEKIGCPEGSYDLVSVAGSAKDLVSLQNAEAEFLKKQIRLSLKLHGIKAVILLMHENCGAYGVADKKIELEAMSSDVKKIISELKQTADFKNLRYQAFIILGVETGRLTLQPLSV